MTESSAVKFRVEANTGKAKKMADFISVALEHVGFEVIECTPARPVRDDPGRERAYVTAIPNLPNAGDKSNG